MTITLPNIEVSSSPILIWKRSVLQALNQKEQVYGVNDMCSRLKYNENRLKGNWNVDWDQIVKYILCWNLEFVLHHVDIREAVENLSKLRTWLNIVWWGKIQEVCTSSFQKTWDKFFACYSSFLILEYLQIYNEIHLG